MQRDITYVGDVKLSQIRDLKNAGDFGMGIGIQKKTLTEFKSHKKRIVKIFLLIEIFVP